MGPATRARSGGGHRRVALAAVCALALFGFVGTEVSAADSYCPPGYACFWQYPGYGGNKVPKTNNYAEGVWLNITGQYVWHQSAKNRFDNRKIRIWNSPHYGDPVCLDPTQESANTYYGEDIWSLGAPGSRCH